MTIGRVFLVGAGPGDPELITVKALRRLQGADVVLYDRLISAELLREARADAILINVGKERGTEDLQQTLIHELMIEHAREGKTVCRLQGGDPFVFGRGGEECAALRAAGIPFEVISGVSSAIAAPASAGIAITHRGYNHGFMVIAGNRSHQFDSPEWQAARQLARSGGTVVVMMGLGRAADIAQYLMSGKCYETTPAAVISNGTCKGQQQRTASLRDIGMLAETVPSPAVLIIGDVVRTSFALEESRLSLHTVPQE